MPRASIPVTGPSARATVLALMGLLASSHPALAGQYNLVAEIGDPLPAFEGLPTTDGETISSSDASEEVLVLVSLANHCPWVKGMDRGLIALVDSMKGRSVRVIGFAVNHREDDRLPAMREHAARVGYNFTYAFDESQALGRALGATRTPEYFVYDKERRLVYMGLLHDSPARMTDDGTIRYTKGEPSEFYVRDAVLATLAGEPVAVRETRAHGCTVKYE